MSQSVIELAELMKNAPSSKEASLIQDGAQLIGIFSDPNYTTRRFKNLNQLKIECIQNAIEDISKGVITMRTSTIGLSFQGNQIVHYITPHGSLPSGDVVFSINWKNIVAFKNWRFGQGDDIPQEVIHAAIYYLTNEVARLLDL